MNTSKLADVAEIIGGVAIVASLLFVGFQIKQNSLTVQAQTRTATTEQGRDNIKSSMDPLNLDISAKLDSGVELTAQEQHYVDLRTDLMFRGAENIFTNFE